MEGQSNVCYAREPNMAERFMYWVKNLLYRFKPRQKTNLEIHAENELRIAGMFDGDSDYGGALGHAVMELIKVFSSQEHSGFSAHRTLQLFSKLADYEPLLPLQGTSDEWVDVGAGVYQNKRCSRVFKQGKDGQAYDIDGKVFREPNGSCYTSGESRVYINFPYVPKTEYVNVPEKG